MIERFRLWLAIKLLWTPKVKTATRIMTEQVNTARCIHCGKNPYLTHLESEK